MVTLFDWLEEMVVATAMGLAIGAVYWRLHRGFTYSFTFVQTCVLTVILCTVISRIVSNASTNSTAIAFALVGMLGLIRFRTVVRDTREFAFLFLAITAGIAVGSGSIFAGVTVAEAARVTDKSDHTIKDHLKALVGQGHLTLHGAGRGAWYGLS